MVRRDWVLCQFWAPGVMQLWKLISLAWASHFLIGKVSKLGMSESPWLCLACIFKHLMGEVSENPPWGWRAGLAWKNLLCREGGIARPYRRTGPRIHRVYFFSGCVYLCSPSQVAIHILGLKMFISDPQTWNWQENWHQHVAKWTLPYFPRFLFLMTLKYNVFTFLKKMP